MKKGMYKIKTWLKVLLVTLLFGVPAFILAPRIWPMSSDWPTPTSQQFPFFVLIAVFDSLTFGLGIAFLLFGRPIVQRIANESGMLAWVLYIIIAFMLLSWQAPVRDSAARVNEILGGKRTKPYSARQRPSALQASRTEGSRGSQRMKRMHEQKTLGVRHERLDVARPQKALSLPVHPFNPP